MEDFTTGEITAMIYVEMEGAQDILHVMMEIILMEMAVVTIANQKQVGNVGEEMITLLTLVERYAEMDKIQEELSVMMAIYQKLMGVTPSVKLNQVMNVPTLHQERTNALKSVGME